MSGILLFCMAVFVSLMLCFPIRPILFRWNVLDLPNERSSHLQATVRGGGVAIVAGLILVGFTAGFLRGSELWTLSSMLIGSLGLAVTSFLDDQRSLSARIRFCCHAAIAILVLSALHWPKGQLALSDQISIELPIGLSLGLLFLWLTGYTNAFNFMDGVNGIAAAQAVVTGIGGALVAGLAVGGWGHPAVLLSLVVAGSAAGFLPHNFPRARMFMGDVGSAPLGLLLASLVVWMANRFGWWLMVPLGMLHANFVLDTGITLLRRVVRGERWHQAHREHFYQRLVRGGRSHTFVTGCEMGLQVLVLLCSLLYVRVGPVFRVGIILLVLAIWLAFFAWCEREFRRANGAFKPAQAKKTDLVAV